MLQSVSLKIKTKLTYGIGLLFAMIVLLGGLSVQNIYRMSADTQNILADNYNTLLYSRRMLDALERIKTDPGGAYRVRKEPEPAKGEYNGSGRYTDYLEMPECVYNRVEVSMSEKEMALYEQLERDMLLPFADGDIDAVNAAALANKLLQMADGAVYDENGNVKHIHDRKLEALEDLIEAANGKPVLIVYWYKHDLQRIMERTRAVELDTAEDMQKWNAGEIPVAAIHPASAGHGLNLQAGGSTLIWFGLTWSLELYQQMNARLWRQGQEETVVIHHLISRAHWMSG